MMISAFSLLRPRQWIKNFLVFGAPLAAGSFTILSNLFTEIRVFILFCIVASLGYIINDLRDLDLDRVHPTKKQRPLASGALGKKVALTWIVILSILWLSLSMTFNLSLNLIVISYFLVSVSYSMYLKRIPVVEMIWLSFGFLLRPLGGAAAISIPVSEWFLIVISFSALFLVATKRLSELSKRQTQNVRLVIDSYTPKFLEFVLSVSVSISLTAYSLWAFGIMTETPWAKISVLPVVVGVIRYAWVQEKHDGERPEYLILKDRIIPTCGLFTAILIAMSVYA